MKKGKKYSKLDEHIDYVKELLESGLTYSEICDKLLEEKEYIVAESTLCLYVKSRKLRSYVTQGAKNGRIKIPVCDKCANCKTYKFYYKNATKIRCCTKTQEAINPNVATSPMNCPKREVNAIV